MLKVNNFQQGREFKNPPSACVTYYLPIKKRVFTLCFNMSKSWIDW